MNRIFVKWFSGLLFCGILFTPKVALADSGTQCVTNAVAGGTGDVITTQKLPCGATTNLLILTLTSTNTTVSPTLQPVGMPDKTIVGPDGRELKVGKLKSGSRVLLTSTGSNWVLVGGGANIVDFQLRGSLTTRIPIAGEVLFDSTMLSGERLTSRNIGNWQIRSKIAPAAPWIFTLKINGALVATGTVLAGYTTGSWVWNANTADVSFSGGESLTLSAPGIQDSTGKGISYTIVGEMEE